MYFNEHDKFAAQWLRNLWPAATVDERDIRDVRAADVAGFQRCHFFGGIGGWEYALQLAGWVGPVWTGSCPCQPFSDAGDKKGTADDRHLWPEFCRLIEERRPAIVFGEQVASKLGREWLAGVRVDLEALGYEVGAADLCAAGAEAPQLRHRLYWVASSEGSGYSRSEHAGSVEEETSEGRVLGAGGHGSAGWVAGTAGRGNGQASQRAGNLKGEAQGRVVVPRGHGDFSRLGCADEPQQRRGRAEQRKPGSTLLAAGSDVNGLAGGDGERFSIGQESNSEAEQLGQQAPRWRDASGCCHVVPLTDGTFRRFEPGSFPVAPRIPRDLGRRIPKLRSVAASARNNRVGRLKGYGNAIVPQLAAEFIRAFMEVHLTEPPPHVQ